VATTIVLAIINRQSAHLTAFALPAAPRAALALVVVGLGPLALRHRRGATKS